MKKVLSWLLICAMLLSLPLTVIAATDATSTDAPQTATPIPFYYKDGAYHGGNTWEMFAIDGDLKGNVVFKPTSESGECNSITISDRLVNAETGIATINPVVQYQGKNPASYELSYDVKFAENNQGQIWAFFYWNDVLEDGRSFEVSTKHAGYALRVTSDHQGIYYDVMTYTKEGGYGRISKATTGTRLSADFMSGAEAGAEINISLKWDETTKTVSGVITRKDTSAKMEVTFNLSADANISAVTNPAGFALMDSSATVNTDTKKDVKPLASIGNVTVKDLTKNDSDATAVPFSYKDGVYYGGNTWKMYTADTGFKGNAVFQPTSVSGDCNTVTISDRLLNSETGIATMDPVIQYSKKNPESYELTFDVKLSSDKKGQVWAYFYWNDVLSDGRSFEVAAKAAGYALRVTADGDAAYYDVIAYSSTAGYNRITTATEGSTRYSADFMKDAAEGVELSISLKWDAGTKMVSGVITRKDTSAKMEATFDLSSNPHIGAVTDPAGFALRDSTSSLKAKPLAYIGNITMTGVESTPAPNTDWILSAIDPNSFATLSEGDKFVLGNDGWFTRSDAKATNNAAIVYKKPVTYNHEISFNVRLNSENKGRIGIWNIWDGNFGGTHFGYMLVLLTDATGKLSYRLCRYNPGYDNVAEQVATAESKDHLSGSKILEGQAPNAELAVKVKIENYTITVDTSLASDPTKKIETVIFNLSGDAEMKVHRKVDRTKGFAILDMGPSIDGGAGASAAIGNIVYTSLPGEPLPIEPEVDNNDYDAILKTTYPWSGDIAVTEDNFNFYFHDIATLKPTDGKFTISNGWLTRPAETPSSAYGFAQYKGVMSDTSRDYKLTFSIKCNEDNQCRVSAVTRWEDTDDTSCYDMRKQVGYRFYIYSTAEKLQIFCYQTGVNRYLDPVAATAENANSDMLLNLTEKNVQLDVTMVMKDDIVVIEVHLASDPAKTTGPVAFKLSETASLFSQIDYTQGFFIAESSNETANDKEGIPAIAPAEIGNIKLYAAAAPENGGNNSGEEGDPDEDLKPPVTKPSTDETTDEKPRGDSTTDPAGDDGKKGCKSSVSVSLAMVAGLALGASAIVCRKKKEND